MEIVVKSSRSPASPWYLKERGATSSIEEAKTFASIEEARRFAWKQAGWNRNQITFVNTETGKAIF